MNIIFLSELADKAFIEFMKSKGTIILVPRDDRFDPRISSHPDLVISIIDHMIVIDQHASDQIFQQLKQYGIPYVLGNTFLEPTYPKDIAFNAVITDSLFVHKLNTSDYLLSLHSKNTGKTMCNVKQGYTKCSTVVIDNLQLITSDQGIYHATKDLLPVLNIQPGYVLLEGYDYGFLGGASGFVEDTLIFHGDLSNHPDFDRITAFVSSVGMKIHYFKHFPLTDIGSVLVYKQQEHTDISNKKEVDQKHVNIPIFISHEGCPNDCVFCNQRKITSKSKAMSVDDIEEQILSYSSSLDEKTFIELAFFGGSFTGIDINLQENYLQLASQYKKEGRIHGIRLSTRPDYITDEILTRLKLYGVDTIELGVQSLCDKVLTASNRGHQVADVYNAVKLIKAYGFQLGIQLMVGLPEDTKERAILSSKLTALLNPDFVRIYPTLVIQETQLLDLCNQGLYQPLSLEDAVNWTKEMYRVFLTSQIPVIRIGLQPTDLIATGKEVRYGPFHPAFRQLVESSYFFDEITKKLSGFGPGLHACQDITILCNPKDLSQVIGHKRSNMTRLKQDYPNLRVIPDEYMKPLQIQIKTIPIIDF